MPLLFWSLRKCSIPQKGLESAKQKGEGGGRKEGKGAHHGLLCHSSSLSPSPLASPSHPYCNSLHHPIHSQTPSLLHRSQAPATPQPHPSHARPQQSRCRLPSPLLQLGNGSPGPQSFPVSEKADLLLMLNSELCLFTEVMFSKKTEFHRMGIQGTC